MKISKMSDIISNTLRQWKTNGIGTDGVKKKVNETLENPQSKKKPLNPDANITLGDLTVNAVGGEITSLSERELVVEEYDNKYHIWIQCPQEGHILREDEFTNIIASFPHESAIVLKIKTGNTIVLLKPGIEIGGMKNLVVTSQNLIDKEKRRA